MRENRGTGWTLGVLVAVLALVAAACSSDDSETVSDDSETVTEAIEESADTTVSDGSDTETEETTQAAEEEETQAVEIVSFEGADADVDLISFSTSAFGGARFSMDPSHYVYAKGDLITVSIADPTSPESWESASVGLITQDVGGSKIDTVEQVLQLTREIPTAEVEPTGTAVELFGYQLVGYRVAAGIDQAETLLYGAERLGSPVMSNYGFFPHAEIFMAETPAGVLVAGLSEADSESNLDLIRPALGTLLNTIELTGPGLDAPLPAGSFLQPAELTEDEPRGELDPDGPDPLDSPFVPVPAGSYQLANFGDTFTIDLAEDWFAQPNFPGFIVLTVPVSGGPGDRDLVFLTGVSEVVPTAGGSNPIGDPIVIENVQTFLDLSLTGVEVSNVEEVKLGDVSATRFDITVSSDAACTIEAPCEYTFLTNTGVGKDMQATRTHRIWWIDDQSHGPSMIVAMAPPGDPFLDTATNAVATIVFP